MLSFIEISNVHQTLSKHTKNVIVRLLKAGRRICCNQKQNNDKVYTVMNSLRALFINFQKSEVSNNYYLKKYQARVAIFDDYNMNILYLIPCLPVDNVKEKYNKDIMSASESELKAAKESVKKKTLVAILMIGADHGMYGERKNYFNKTWIRGWTIIQD